MATVSQALYAEWLAGVRAEHLAEGIEQGTEQERTRGLARLRRQVAIKFGAATAERLTAVLAAAGAQSPAHLVDRVSDWVVECERGEDLLSRVSALVGNGGAEG